MMTEEGPCPESFLPGRQMLMFWLIEVARTKVRLKFPNSHLLGLGSDFLHRTYLGSDISGSARRFPGKDT